MSRMRHSKPLQLLALLSSLLLVLAGCGGHSGSGGSGAGSGSTTRVRHITLQLSRSAQVVSTARNQGIASAQGRQVQSGDAGFIDHLTIQMQTPQGVDLLTPQNCPLGPADQETATCTVAILEPPPAQLQILISAFNQGQIKIFLGNTTIQNGQSSATITLVRNPDPNTLIPVLASPASLQQTVFPFTDGAVFGFGLAGAPVTLAAGSFTGNTGDFTLTAGGFAAGGQVVIGSCNFVFTVSTFPSGRGPQGGDRVTFDPCQVDAVDGRLMGTNTSLNISATSETPISASSTGVLVLPSSPPTLVTDEDTGGTVQITAALAGSRPGGLTFAITEFPAHGTAVVDTTGLVTYRPGADFNGSDRLVVTVTATFTDGNAPPLALGTVPIAITVRSINDPPRITHPGNQTTPEGQAVSLPMSASDPDNNALTYSATGLPPGLNIDTTTGLISGTIAFAAVVDSASHTFPVTVTVSDSIANASTSFTWTITKVNQPPVVTTCAPAQTIFEFDTLAFMVSATDSNNDTLTFAWQQLTPSEPTGVFMAPNAARTTWTAPAVTIDTAFTLQVTAQNPQGAATSCQVVVTVRSTSAFILDTSRLDDDTQRLQ